MCPADAKDSHEQAREGDTCCIVGEPAQHQFTRNGLCLPDGWVGKPATGQVPNLSPDKREIERLDAYSLEEH